MTVAIAVEWGMWGSWTTKLCGAGGKWRSADDPGAGSEGRGGVAEGRDGEGIAKGEWEGDGSVVAITNVLGIQLKGT